MTDPQLSFAAAHPALRPIARPNHPVVSLSRILCAYIHRYYTLVSHFKPQLASRRRLFLARELAALVAPQMTEHAQWSEDDVQYMRAALQQVRRWLQAGGNAEHATHYSSAVLLPPCHDQWETLLQACIALEEAEVPVGCIVVRDGRIAATGSNKTNAERNVRGAG